MFFLICRCDVCDSVFAREENLKKHMEEYHTNDDGEKGKEHEMLMYKYVINEKVQEKERRHPNKCEFCQSILWCKISELKKHIFFCEKNPTNMRKNIQKKSAEILNEAINKALNNRDQM